MRVRGWITVVVVGAAVSALLAVAGLPSPVLFGALAGGMAQALSGRVELDLPRSTFQVGQALLGAALGGLVSVPALRELGSNAWQIGLVTIATLVLSILAGQGLRLQGVSATTGAFAMVAGGASGIVALARELGADERVVGVVQYLRVLIVLLLMPVVTTVVFQPPRRDGAAAAGTAGGPWPADLALTVLAVGLGLLVARWTRLPAGSLLGPLLVSVALVLSGVLGDAAVPDLLQQVAYALIGAQVGLRFTRASLRSIARLVPLAVGLVLLVVLACAGLGLLLAETTGVSRLDAYLATTPGGAYAVLATAVGTGGDVTFVLAVQVIRLFAVLLLAPLLARVLRPRPT